METTMSVNKQYLVMAGIALVVSLVVCTLVCVVGSRYPRFNAHYMNREVRMECMKDGECQMMKMDGKNMGGMSMGGMNHTMSMKSMMMDMSASLKGKTGDQFDKAFLSEMIEHHQGAVDMAKMVLETSKRPELIKLANDIIKAQEAEIKMMQGWQTSWFPAAQ